jgi:GAF domain-containing protein
VTDTSQPADQVFAQLGKIVLGEHPLPQILERVVHLASQMVPGAVHASITVIAGDEPATLAFTGDVAIALDERQYEDEAGPCLASAQAGQMVYVSDISSETRWPRFATAAKEREILSSLSMPLPVQRNVTGALNFYAGDTNAFDDEAIALAETFAGHAAVAVANAHLYETTAALAEQMRQAMQSRAVIEQAKGILMRDRGCSADEAFDALVHLSQESHRKLRDVAQLLVDQVTGNNTEPEDE